MCVFISFRFQYTTLPNERKSGSASQFAPTQKAFELHSQNYALTDFADPWSTKAHNLINKIGKTLNLIQCNAACVMSTVPETSSFDEIFNPIRLGKIYVLFVTCRVRGRLLHLTTVIDDDSAKNIRLTVCVWALSKSNLF